GVRRGRSGRAAFGLVVWAVRAFPCGFFLAFFLAYSKPRHTLPCRPTVNHMGIRMPLIHVNGGMDRSLRHKNDSPREPKALIFLFYRLRPPPARRQDD